MNTTNQIHKAFNRHPWQDWKNEHRPKVKSTVYPDEIPTFDEQQRHVHDQLTINYKEVEK